MFFFLCETTICGIISQIKYQIEGDFGMEKNKVRIQIGQKNYTLSGNAPEESLYRVGAYVDKKMQEIAAALPSLSTTDTAVLAAVNIADELLRLRDEQNGMHSRLAQILEEQQQSEVQAAREDLLPKLPDISMATEASGRSTAKFATLLTINTFSSPLRNLS